MNTHDLEAFQTLVLHEGRNYSLARNFEDWKETAERLHGRYERMCNGTLSEEEKRLTTAGEEQLRSELLKLDSVEAVRFNRDPRDKPVKIYFDQERAENNHTPDVRI